MTEHGLAMRMRVELAQLARRHNVAPTLSCTLPLAEPVDYPVQISGLAVSNSIDQERMKFRAYCPTFLPWSPPPLLFRHAAPAGEILAIRHDAKGRLVVDARVDHPEARRCQGLSVCATIEAFEICNAESPDYYALITKAFVDEVSSTPAPACSDCVVTSRIVDYQPGKLFELAAQGVGKMIEVVELLQKVNTRPQRSHVRRLMSAALPRPRMVRQPSQFSQLVAMLPTGDSP